MILMFDSYTVEARFPAGRFALGDEVPSGTVSADGVRLDLKGPARVIALRDTGWSNVEGPAHGFFQFALIEVVTSRQRR